VNTPVQYRKNGDLVELRGFIAGGTIGAPAFILPVGFRPYQANENFIVDSNSSAFGRILVLKGGANPGEVRPNPPSVAAFVCLSGIRFSTVA
jgi:hypothetical protein